MGVWKYEIVHDYNATRLIKEFREENLELKNARGSNDDEIDFIVYAEKDDFTISLGRVLLIKMSDAMIKYYYEYKGTENLTQFWAKYIYQKHRNVNTFFFKQDEISDAFINSIKLQTELVRDITVLDAQNFIKRLSGGISTFFHQDLKFSREQWDPTLKSDKYLFKKPEQAVNYFVKNSNNLLKELHQLKEKLQLIKSFNLAEFEFDTPLVDYLIKAIDNKIKSVQKFKNWLIKNRDEVQLKIPYICGVWNGMVEFVAGIVDVVLLALNVLIDEVLEDSINLELLTVREGIEEVLSQILKDPVKIIDEVIKSIKNYKYTRYDDPSLNKFQIQYNEGEDTILAIDIIVTIITIIKGIAKLAKQLKKFTKWIDDVLARNGKGSLKLEETLQESRRSYKKIGVIEYEILSSNLLKKYIEDVIKVCKQRGINLEIKWIDNTHPEFNSDLLGRLDVSMKNKKMLRLNLRPECPKITWFHERKHLEDFLELGHRKYKQIYLKTPWKHEESVWNYIYKNRNKWSEPELVDAYEYVKKYHKDRYQKFQKINDLEKLREKLGLTKK